MADFKPTPRRTLFLVLGCLTTGLGILGVFVPGLPATPFLLLSSWLFYRSSRTLHDRLLRSPLGHYIRDYERHRGMGVRAKAWAVCLMAVMVGISAGWVLEQTVLRILVAAAGAVGCITVLFIVPTRKVTSRPEKRETDPEENRRTGPGRTNQKQTLKTNTE